VPELQALTGRRFRANPRLELVLFDRLTPEERERYAVLTTDPEFYGMLCARDGKTTSKAVSRETALLCFTLQELNALPEYVVGTLGAGCAAAVARLVLDGVLEMETAAGELVSGPAAHVYFDARADTAFAPHELEAGAHPLARLSRAAVRYAASLDLRDPIELSLRLYQFHRVPAGLAWRRRFPTDASVVQWLGIAPDGAASRALDPHYARVQPTESHLRWHMWRRRTTRLRAVGSHKLYVSPATEQLPETLDAVIPVLASHGVPAFKIGNDLGGVLRPDKLVIYLASEAHVHDLAGALRERLAGISAHGVPFTAPAGNDCLLSWGMDPPERSSVSPWRRLSWRLFLTDRLGASLAAAAAAPSAVPAWRYALDRLALDGVDTDQWAFTPALWSASAPTA
jgi:hypothetical protein